MSKKRPYAVLVGPAIVMVVGAVGCFIGSPLGVKYGGTEAWAPLLPGAAALIELGALVWLSLAYRRNKERISRVVYTLIFALNTLLLASGLYLVFHLWLAAFPP